MAKGLDDLAAELGHIPTEITGRQESEVPLSLLTDQQDRVKALKSVEDFINKKFKTTLSLVRLGDKVGLPIPSISGRLPTLDRGVIGTGGIPRGRIIEIFGPESSGKTTITLNYVAEEQSRGGLAAFIDAEHALDPNYMKACRVDVDNLIVSQPDSGEQALDTAEALVESRAVSLIVIDSVAALVPKAELDGDMGDSHMGLQARLMSQACRKLRGKCAINGVSIIFINQIREKIGVMFGNPETTTGGRALKFYSSVRLDVRRVSKTDGGEIMNGSNLIGHKMRIRAVKNKVGTPGKSTEINLLYGKGLDNWTDMVQYSVDTGVIERSGAWYSFKGEKLGQGLTNSILTLENNPELFNKIRAEAGI